MKQELISKKLTVILNDDMLRFASEQGYRLPCVSINHYYGNTGIFKIKYKNNQPDAYELSIFNDSEDCIAIYLMNT